MINDTDFSIVIKIFCNSFMESFTNIRPFRSQFKDFKSLYIIIKTIL